jgi:proteic killer suppression protein
MIRSFRHKGLKRLHEDDDARGLNAGHVEKLRRILARLDIARVPQDLDLPGYRLHPLKGGLKGFWAVAVQANWRVVFRLEEGQVFAVDYTDYH